MSRSWAAFPAAQLILLSLATLATPEQGLALDLHWNGYLEESYANQVVGPARTLYHRQTFNSQVTGELLDWIDVQIDVDFRYDDPDFKKSSDFVAYPREAYLRLKFDNFDLRLGRQQIVWGEADGLIVSDQVSPFDLSNFIVPRFDAIRMGVDGASLDYYFDDGSDLQLIWIAVFEPPNFPSTNSPWSFVDADTLEANELTRGRSDSPSRTPLNGEFGARYSRHPSWGDWSVGYLRSVDDRPAPRLEGTGVRPDLLVPTHRFFHLLTANVVAPVGGTLVRMDTAFEEGRYLGVDTGHPGAVSKADTDFLSKQDVWRLLLGLDTKPDVPFWEQADASFQYIHEEVISPGVRLAQAPQSDLLSVTLRASYLHDTIHPFVFWIIDLRGNSTWLQLKIDYEPWDNWRFAVEYDLFEGHAYNPRTDSGGIYGSFDANDLVQFTIRRSF